MNESPMSEIKLRKIKCTTDKRTNALNLFRNQNDVLLTRFKIHTWYTLKYHINRIEPDYCIIYYGTEITVEQCHMLVVFKCRITIKNQKSIYRKISPNILTTNLKTYLAH